MESNIARSLPFCEEKIEEKNEETKNLIDRTDSPTECIRSESPSSDASTSGVCSMASSDFESSEEIIEEKPQIEQDILPKCPVIMYEKRNILDMFENIYPFSIYQATYVPKMNMSNYWERRSIYYRLGPYGRLDEFDLEKCHYCDFYKTVPKRL